MINLSYKFEWFKMIQNLQFFKTMCKNFKEVCLKKNLIILFGKTNTKVVYTYVYRHH